jgi:hypothetical protein
MYGCNNNQSPEETRIFPYLLSKLCPFFAFNHCRFGVQKSKEATARVALFKELKISNVFTMESSFCGNDQGKYAGYHFNIENFESIGREFCRTLLVHCDISIPKELEDMDFDDFDLMKKDSSEDEEVEAEAEADIEEDMIEEEADEDNSPIK